METETKEKGMASNDLLTITIPGDTVGSLGSDATKAVLGGKAYGLLEIASLGIDVPPAFCFTTNVWRAYRETGEIPSEAIEAMNAFVTEQREHNPHVMFSVRSGAPVSMPGMMDTILNVGATPDTPYLGAYRRFVRGWLEIVLGVEKGVLDKVEGGLRDGGLDPMSKECAALLHKLLTARQEITPSESLEANLRRCAEAVFDSWDTPRAQSYRKEHGIPDDMGTACIVQVMVMGTAPGFSGSGVAFTRDPSTGYKKLTGEFALDCQGEELVSGEITPRDLTELATQYHESGYHICKKLNTWGELLEKHFREVQDIEFTFEGGKLYLLQTRTAKMSARAKIVTATSFALYLINGGSPLVAYDLLRSRVNMETIHKAQAPQVNSDAPPILTGLAASPGAVCGRVVTRKTPLHKIDKNCVFVAEDTTPDDFDRMLAAGAILTAVGGFTSHAAVVARGICHPAVVGAGDLKFDHNGEPRIGETPLTTKTKITLDGTDGRIWIGEVPVEAGELPGNLKNVLYMLVGKEEFRDKHLSGVPKDKLWFADYDLAQQVVVNLPLSDLDALEGGLARAGRLHDEGKTVGIFIEEYPYWDDLFPRSPIEFVSEAVDMFGADLRRFALLGGMSADLLAKELGISIVEGQSSIKLLDLLGGD